jgi:hypothetical protein
MNCRYMLLTGASLALFAPPAFGQQATTTTQQQPANAPTAQADTSAAQSVNEDYGDEEPIVVQGTRARGSVIGDIPPQNILDSRDVRATGATSINDAISLPKRSSGSRSCPRKWRSNMAIAPTRRS